MKHVKLIIAACAVILVAGLVLWRFVMPASYLPEAKNTATAVMTVGIIGSADGPTSIFVAQTINIILLIALIAAPVLIAIGIVLFIRKNKH